MAVLEEYSKILKQENEALSLNDDQINAWHNNPVTKHYINEMKIVLMDIDPTLVDYKKALENLIETSQTYYKDGI